MGEGSRETPCGSGSWGAGRTSRPPRIFLGEDDEAMRSLLSWLFHEDGCEVIEADNGIRLADALHLGNKAGAAPDADLVISDIRMPGATGLQILEALRELDRPIPCILMTAFGDPQVHEEALRLGAAAVFDKPLDVNELRDLVRKILHIGPGSGS